MSHNISKNIKYLRKKRGQSQEKLATQLDMSRGNIASYEGGKALPSAEKLLRLSNYFEVDISDMIHEDLEKVQSASDVTLNGSAESAIANFEAFNLQARKIVEGLKEFHNYQSAGKNEWPAEFAHIKYDYERLLALLEESLELGADLINGVRTMAD